jgi:hypothetical protein
MYILLLILLWSRHTTGFLPPVSSVKSLTSLHASPFPQVLSADLLPLLQQKASASTANLALDAQINTLIQSLVATRAPFNPETCIGGPLFATIHFIGENTPLWEKIAFGGVRNVKGQKYTLADGKSGTFANYAEIFGRNLFLKATGTFNDVGAVSTLNEATANVKKTNNPFESIASLFTQNSQSTTKRNIDNKSTPYEYEALVTGASLVLFQKYSVDINIEGAGTVRVLYADENLRIFLSPTDTEVTAGGGDWEREGLIVAQVRVDLVYKDWVDVL